MVAGMADITIIENADVSSIAGWLQGRLGRAGAITIPGGSTPFPILAELGGQSGVGWSGWAVWPNDDRIVPEAHDASNTGKIRALLAPLGAQIAALAEDAAPPHFALTWLGKHGNPYKTTLFDADGRVGLDFGVYGVPETYVIDKQGVIRLKFTGPVTPEAVRDTLLPLMNQLGA